MCVVFFKVYNLWNSEGNTNGTATKTHDTVMHLQIWSTDTRSEIKSYFILYLSLFFIQRNIDKKRKYPV